MPKIIHFNEFLKTYAVGSNSSTRQVTLNRTKIGGKCLNSKIQIWHFEQFSNNVRIPIFLSFPIFCQKKKTRKKVTSLMNVLCFCSLLQLATPFRMVVCPFWKALPITLETEKEKNTWQHLCFCPWLKSEGGHSLANYDITFKRFWGGQWVTLNISKQKILWKVILWTDCCTWWCYLSPGCSLRWHGHFPFPLWAMSVTAVDRPTSNSESISRSLFPDLHSLLFARIGQQSTSKWRHGTCNDV